jgi:hypothetical protein
MAVAIYHNPDCGTSRNVLAGFSRCRGGSGLYEGTMPHWKGCIPFGFRSFLSL